MYVPRLAAVRQLRCPVLLRLYRIMLNYLAAVPFSCFQIQHEMFVRDMPQLSLKMKRIKKGEKGSRKRSGSNDEDDGEDADSGGGEGEMGQDDDVAMPSASGKKSKKKKKKKKASGGPQQNEEVSSSPPAIPDPSTLNLPGLPSQQGQTQGNMMFPGLPGQPGVAGLPSNLQGQQLPQNMGQVLNLQSLSGGSAAIPGLPNQLQGLMSNLQGLPGQNSGGLQIPGLNNAVQESVMQSLAGQLPAGLQSLLGQVAAPAPNANQQAPPPLQGLLLPGLQGMAGQLGQNLQGSVASDAGAPEGSNGIPSVSTTPAPGTNGDGQQQQQQQQQQPQQDQGMESSDAQQSGSMPQNNFAGLLPPLPGAQAAVPGLAQLDSATLMKLQEALTAAAGGGNLLQQFQQKPQQDGVVTNDSSSSQQGNNQPFLSQNGSALAAQLQAVMQPNFKPDSSYQGQDSQDGDNVKEETV